MDTALANSFYYAFSTFSQTLAGAIGFLGAVVLYRIQGLDTEINVYGESVVTYWPKVSPDDENVDAVKAHRYWRLRQLPELLALVANTPAALASNPQRKEDYGRLVSVLRTRAQLVNGFYVALALTTLAIMMSGLVLVCGHAIGVRAARWLLGIGYAAFVACFVSYGFIAVTIFRSPRAGPATD